MRIPHRANIRLQRIRLRLRQAILGAVAFANEALGVESAHCRILNQAVPNAVGCVATGVYRLIDRIERRAGNEVARR